MSRSKAFSTGAAVVAAAFGMTVGLSTAAYAVDTGTATYSCSYTVPGQPTQNPVVTGTFTTDSGTVSIEGNIGGLTQSIGADTITTTLRLNNATNAARGPVVYSGTVNDATTLPYVYLGPLPKTSGTPNVGDVLNTGTGVSLTLVVNGVTVSCTAQSQNSGFTGGLTYQ